MMLASYYCFLELLKQQEKEFLVNIDWDIYKITTAIVVTVDKGHAVKQYEVALKVKNYSQQYFVAMK